MESIKKLKLTTLKNKMFFSLLVLLGLFLLIIQDAFSYSVNLERVSLSTVYNPYWENAGVSDSNQADWYRFSYTPASRLILNLKGLTAPYVALTLYKNDQQIVVVNSDSTVNIAFPGAGTYYIRVTGYTGVKYAFSVTHLC